MGAATRAPRPVSDDPDELLLDAMFSPEIAERLQDRGIDCRAAAADPELRTGTDRDVLEWAIATNRVLVTNNVGDFERLRLLRLQINQPVPALIYTSDRSFPRNRRFIARVVDALDEAARQHLCPRYGGVYWLQNEVSSRALARGTEHTSVVCSSRADRALSSVFDVVPPLYGPGYAPTWGDSSVERSGS